MAAAAMSSNLANSLNWARDGGPGARLDVGGRDPATSTTTMAPGQDANSTFYRSASIFINEPIGSMSLSPANRDVVLAARKGLYIVDLESPFAPPRFLAQLSSWEAADVQWSPHPARSHWVASTSNDRLLIWNLDRPEGAPRRLPPFMSESGVSAGGRGHIGRGTRMSRPANTGSMTSAHSNEHLAALSVSPSSTAAAHSVYHQASSGSSLRSSAIEYVLQAHTRAITDINFSAHHPDILASCAIDAWSWVWDLRTPGKPVQGYSAWNAGATQVKWNRSTPHRLATAVANKVLIWDDRKGALPLATIEAHENMIYGLDWSRDTTSAGLDQLITCSLDGAVKWWDLSAPASKEAIAARTRITEPEQVIQTATPIARARHLPFGRGVMTLPQRGDHTLSMWARDDQQPDGGPVERFVGHRDIVKEYLIRTRGGGDVEHDDRRFQLITWSKDQTLRLWPISDETMQKVGHKPGGPIKVLQTRRNAKNISYRDPPAPAPASESTTGPVGNKAASGSTTSVVLPDGSASFHRSSILPPPDATAALLSARGSGIPRLGGPRSPGSGSARSHEDLAAGTSASFGNRGSILSTSAGAEAYLSKSYPKLRGPGGATARSQDKGTVTFGQRPQPHPRRARMGRHDSNRSHGSHRSTGGGAAAAAGGQPLSAGAKLRADARKSRQLAQSAAATYMTRGAGNNVAGTADMMLRHHLRIGALGATVSSTLGGVNIGANATGVGSDAVTWISGVRVDKEPTRRSKSEAPKLKDAEKRRRRKGEKAATRPVAGLQRGVSDTAAVITSSGADDSVVTAAQADGDDSEDFDLQHEIIDVAKTLPHLTVEKVDLTSSSRSCTLSLYGPWAHGHRSGSGEDAQVFLRLDLSFSQSYPAEAPHYVLEHNASVTQRTRTFLLKGVDTILAECSKARQGCMEPCARFLAGEESVELGVGGLVLVVRDSYATQQGGVVREVSSEAAAGEDANHVVRVPTGARCGARFAPDGQLCVFRLAPSRAGTVSSSSRGTPSMPPSPGSSTDEEEATLPFLPAPLVASIAASSVDVSRPGTTVGSVQGGPTDDRASRRARGGDGSANGGGGGGGGGDRFLRSYAEITAAMESLTRMGIDGNGDGGNRKLRKEQQQQQEGEDESILSPHVAATAAEPELLALMSTEFLARRIQARSVSNSSKGQRRRGGASDGVETSRGDERRGRQGRGAVHIGSRSRSIARGGDVEEAVDRDVQRSRSVVVTAREAAPQHSHHHDHQQRQRQHSLVKLYPLDLDPMVFGGGSIGKHLGKQTA